MLLFEAKAEIDERLKLAEESNYKEQIPEYIEALEIASKCIEKQIELADLLNDWEQTIDQEIERGDMYSVSLCHDIVKQFSIFEEEEE